MTEGVVANIPVIYAKYQSTSFGTLKATNTTLLLVKIDHSL